MASSLFMKYRVYRYFNTADPRNYSSRQAHEGITRKSVDEQRRATGEVNNI